MRSKFLSIFVVLLSLLASVGVGCQPQSQPGTYTDDMGREVSLQEIPQRIVSSVPSVTEMLFALGVEEKVVGVSDYSDYPEEAKLKPSVGSYFNPSIEKIVDLKPDLVLTGGSDKQLMVQFDSLGITFLALDPKDIDGILKNIELLGKVTGMEGRAREVVKDMEDRISQVARRAKDAHRVRVIYIIDATDLNNPWTAGPGSFIDSLIVTAGGQNIGAKALAPWVQFSIEQIVSADPEIIILPARHGTAFTAPEVLKGHPAWREIIAVRLGRIYLIDADIVNRPGPRIVQGLEEIAKIIHPELFK